MLGLKLNHVSKRAPGHIDSQGNLTEIMCNFVIITVRADGLPPSGAKPSAATAMT